MLLSGSVLAFHSSLWGKIIFCLRDSCITMTSGQWKAFDGCNLSWGKEGRGTRSAFVRFLQRNWTNRTCVCGEIVILRNWLTGQWGQARPNSAGSPACWRPRKTHCFNPSSQAIRLENFLLVRGCQSFIPVRPSTDWTRPTHFMESNLFYSKWWFSLLSCIQLMWDRGL